MDTDAHEYLFQSETYKIVGCAMAVLNSVGCGFYEKTYENSLVVEFAFCGIACRQQPRYEVKHRNVVVGEYIPDLIAYDAIIVDAKTIEKITDHERGQMPNYLKVTGLHVGLIVNFKHARLEWERVVL